MAKAPRKQVTTPHHSRELQERMFKFLPTAREVIPGPSSLALVVAEDNDAKYLNSSLLVPAAVNPPSGGRKRIKIFDFFPVTHYQDR